MTEKDLLSNNKISYTKGKWEPIFERFPKEPKTICTGVGINSRIDDGIYTEFICNSMLPDDDEEYIKQREEIEANMKLIAAAPDMLKALQRGIEYIHNDDTDVWKEMKQAINKAIK